MRCNRLIILSILADERKLKKDIANYSSPFRGLGGQQLPGILQGAFPRLIAA